MPVLTVCLGLRGSARTAAYGDRRHCRCWAGCLLLSARLRPARCIERGLAGAEPGLARQPDVSGLTWKRQERRPDVPPRHLDRCGVRPRLHAVASLAGALRLVLAAPGYAAGRTGAPARKFRANDQPHRPPLVSHSAITPGAISLAQQCLPAS